MEVWTTPTRDWLGRIYVMSDVVPAAGPFWRRERAEDVAASLRTAYGHGRLEGHADGESAGFIKGRAECARNWLDGWRHGRAAGRNESKVRRDARTGRFVRVG